MNRHVIHQPPPSRPSDAEWLHALFVVPARDLSQLPAWARPVVTPPRPNEENR